MRKWGYSWSLHSHSKHSTTELPFALTLRDDVTSMKAIEANKTGHPVEISDCDSNLSPSLSHTHTHTHTHRHRHTNTHIHTDMHFIFMTLSNGLYLLLQKMGNAGINKYVLSAAVWLSVIFFIHRKSVLYVLMRVSHCKLIFSMIFKTCCTIIVTYL